MVVLVGSYLATGIAAQMAVGSGTSGLGLANPGTSDNVFAALAGPVMGPGLGILLFVAVLASAAASLQTTFIPVARTVLAMSTYEALPASYARVHPRFKTPGRATITAGVATGVFYTVMTLVSEHVLVDTIYALGLMICFYYALTAFGCVWFFRADLTRSFRDLLFKGLFPGSAASCSRRSSARRSTTCGTRRTAPARRSSASARCSSSGSDCCCSAWC